MTPEPIDPHALYEQGQKAYYQGDYSGAQADLEQALALFLNNKDISGATPVSTLLGDIFRRQGNYNTAQSRYMQALEMARSTGDKSSEVTILTNLGAVFTESGDVRQAIEYFEQALPIARAIGDRRGEAAVLTNLGLASAQAGELRTGRGYLDQALVIARQISDPSSEAAILTNLGSFLTQSGDVRQAIEYLQQALVIARETHDPHREAAVLTNLGLAHAQAGEAPEEAAKFVEEARAIYTRLGDSSHIPQVEAVLEQIKQQKAVGPTEETAKTAPGKPAAQELNPEPATIPKWQFSRSLSQAIKIAESLRTQIQNPDGDQIFTEILVIGLNQLPDEAPRALFSAFGLDNARIVASLASERKWQLSSAISYSAAEISDTALASLPYSENLRQVFDVGLRISQEKKSKVIRTRHILAALLEIETSVAYSWLVDMGIPITLVRETVKNIPESQAITPDMFAYAPGVASADLAAEKDTLGFESYAQPLAEIIIKKETVPPVVFGIYGPWGSGKSTFMYLVKKHLERWDKEQSKQKETWKKEALERWIEQDRLIRRTGVLEKKNNGTANEMPRILCVEFNAWAYADSNKLWVGLVRTISQKLDEQIKWWQRPVYWLGRTSWQFMGAVLLSLLPVVIGIAIAFANPLWTWAQNLDIVRFAVSILGFISSIKLVRDQKPLTDIVQSELNKLDRSEIEGVTSRIQKQIHATIEKYFKLTEAEEEPATQESAQSKVRHQKELKLVVFIDELDRCPLEKIVEILESIKLFLAEEIFIVLMAVDTRVAAEAIRLHYKEVENPELAHEYLEKIIQVPIPVPVAKEEHLKTYLESMMSIKEKKNGQGAPEISAPGPTSMPASLPTRAPLPVSLEPFKPYNLEDTVNERQAIIDFSQKYLASNPRRIKRLLNTYRYVKILATRQGMRTDQSDWQVSMIQWLGITMRWPLFMEEAIEQARSLTGLDARFWDNVKDKVPKETYPPDDTFALFPSEIEDLRTFAALANNFIKENPPMPTAEDAKRSKARP